jgi:hypothetical protein
MDSLGVGLAGFVLFMLMSPVLQRVGSRFPAVIVLMFSAVVAHAISIIAGMLLLPRLQYWNAAAVFGFLAMSYAFVFGALYKSVSVKTLIDVSGQPQAAKSLSALIGREMPVEIDNRMAVLCEEGFVERIGELYAVTKRGKSTAEFLRAARWLFGITDPGFYANAKPSSARDYRESLS